METTVDVAAIKKAAKKSKESGGGRVNRMKLKDKTTGVLLLKPMLEGKPFIKEVKVHQFWSNKDRKFLVNVTSPAMYEEEDKIMKAGWKLKKKYADSDNDKLKNLWKMFMPKDHRYVNVINVKDIEAGPQVLNMPKIVFDAVMDEVLELEENQFSTLWDLDEGRVLKITHNGGQGLAKKYEVVKFLNKTANLGSKLNYDDLAKSAADLDRLEPPHDDAKVTEALNILSKIARKIEEQESSEEIDEDAIDAEFEEDTVTESDSDSDSDDEFDLD